MFSLYTAATLAWMAAQPVQPNAQLMGELQIERWVAMAQSQHPQAVAASWQVLAARAQASGANAWMPPSTQVQYRSDGEASLQLSQMIPGPGKISSLQNVRNAQVQMTEADSSDQARNLELAVREAVWMEWMAWEKVKVLASQESVAVQLSESVRRLLGQGMATSSEFWLAQTRARQIHIQREQGFAEAVSATAMRESWTGSLEKGPLQAEPPIAPHWVDSTLMNAADQRADIRSMELDGTMQQAMATSMRASLRPDFMVGGMLMRMTDGMPGWGVMAGMTLPFAPWSVGMARGEAGGASAKAHVAQSRAEAMKKMARSELIAHSVRARAAWTTLTEIETDILPGQDRARTDALMRYAQGKEMLSMVLSMEDMLRMTQMEAIMRRGEYELEQARLLAAAGVDTLAQEGAR